MPFNRKKYHPKWKLIVRLINKRAKNRCEKCGIPNGTRYLNRSKSKQRELFQLAAGEVRLSSARKLDADTWLINDFQRITVTQLAYNDGLDRNDFIEWFKNVGRHNVFACIHFLKFQ